MNITKQTIKKIEEQGRFFFKGASGCHDWTHVERVRSLALRIGRKEKADLKILEIASLLHDIGRKKEMVNKGLFCHAEAGAKSARKILAKFKIDRAIIDKIVHCIETHRYRNNHVPVTIEAKIIYDADKLDSIGAMGIARTFLFSGSAAANKLYTGNESEIAKRKKDYSYTREDSGYLEYEVKLKHIKDKILTKEGKKIAGERHKYMVEYFNRFCKEISGQL